MVCSLAELKLRLKLKLDSLSLLKLKLRLKLDSFQPCLLLNLGSAGSRADPPKNKRRVAPNEMRM